ncbi:hypothetical protein SBV1_2700004 [Verrucomicrobia bacterium]|nr:hypothetical protein SBV1_2700004 [Verrucomicrobiota bacterium]
MKVAPGARVCDPQQPAWNNTPDPPFALLPSQRCPQAAGLRDIIHHPLLIRGAPEPHPGVKISLVTIRPGR